MKGSSDNMESSNMKNNEADRESENKDSIGTFLITPFFINETLIRSDILKIEEILSEKFGDKSDKSEIPQYNYYSYTSIDNIKTLLNKHNDSVDFNFIRKEHFIKNNIYVIDENSKQKEFNFDKISLNTFLKKYFISSDNKNIKLDNTFKSKHNFLNFFNF